MPVSEPEPEPVTDNPTNPNAAANEHSAHKQPELRVQPLEAGNRTHAAQSMDNNGTASAEQPSGKIIN